MERVFACITNVMGNCIVEDKDAIENLLLEKEVGSELIE